MFRQIIKNFQRAVASTKVTVDDRARERRCCNVENQYYYQVTS